MEERIEVQSKSCNFSPRHLENAKLGKINVLRAHEQLVSATARHRGLETNYSAVRERQLGAYRPAMELATVSLLPGGSV